MQKKKNMALVDKLEQNGIWAYEEVDGSLGVGSCFHIMGLTSPEMKRVLAVLLGISVEEIPPCYRIERIAWLQLIARYIADKGEGDG